jgi:ribulose-5-phosphate 4-epimerase/fuculose-1-phosphate aldolase
MVRVDYEGRDRVVAHGFKPSVGAQSQRVVFEEHPEADCIVHFHAPLRRTARDTLPLVDQKPNECGSHQCGEATSRGLRRFGNLKAVMLDGHGPNVVFSRETPASEVISFIEANFDLSSKTGGPVL